MRNPQSASVKLVKALRARRLLLLTATPVENRLDDLFHLVNLVLPGLLGTLPSFRRTYAAGKSGELATNVDALQRQTREVMIRSGKTSHEFAAHMRKAAPPPIRSSPWPTTDDPRSRVAFSGSTETRCAERRGGP